jgi:iron complex outermembrane receptor protein
VTGVAVVTMVLAAGAAAIAQPPTVAVRVEVRNEQGPVPGATVSIAGTTRETGADGIAVITVPPGPTRIVVSKAGYLDGDATVTAAPGGELRVIIELVPQPVVEEEVTVVATTRTGRRVEDEPTRVEVLDREEIEEKLLMTPGDIAMMLNEMGGLRVQATSPSIGAATVRVQGMRGRYTRMLSDGLSLFGQQVGGLGLLQIPPMDLGRVEVIKGVASALYGAGAMGGVVNLISRRPADARAQEALVNVSSLGAKDVVAFASGPVGRGWSASVLGGGHWQSPFDADDDGWADLAGYSRGVARPRLFWDDGAGRSAFLTAGVTIERREGGTVDGAVLAQNGLPYVEGIDTDRFDVGGLAQSVLKERYLLTARVAAAWLQSDHRFGEVQERARRDTAFAEMALRGSAARHTWVAGLAFERDAYRPDEVPRFAFTHTVPGIFAQDDIALASWMSLSVSGRVDMHSEYGTFFSPRLSVLMRWSGWTSRVSVGGGYYAPTPLTEETEAAGLTRLSVTTPLRAERGGSASVDLTRSWGPVSVTVTAFGSRIGEAVAVEREQEYRLLNRDRPSTNAGAEWLATVRRGAYALTSTYTYVRSREDSGSGYRDTPLTPRHSAGIVGMWESEDAGRVGIEFYYTGRQRLEVNPYRDESVAYVIVGALVERRLGRFRLFLNCENLGNVRQTHWDSMLRAAPGPDGRWTVDAWAPLDGRAFNGGVRLAF